jgi:pterin-4a-carbinolamine dehydratase
MNRKMRDTVVRQVGSEGRAHPRRLQQPPRPGRKLKPERVQLMLRTLPGWRLASRGNALRMTRSFTQAGEAAKLAAFAAVLSTVGGHALTLGVTAYQVTLQLQRSRGKGISRPLLEFARQIV